MKRKRLSAKEWLNALVSPESDFTITSFGHQSSVPSVSIGPRIIGDHHISYFIKGAFCSRVATTDYLRKAGSLLWVQPGIEHVFTPLHKDSICSSYWLRFFLGKGSTAYVLEDECIHSSSSQGVPGMLNDIFPLIPLHEEHRDFRVRCLIANILASVLNESKNNEGDKKQGLSNVQKRAVFEFVNKHLRERISTVDIAAHLEINPDYFSRQFKKTMGISVQRFIKSERIKFAKHILLESNRTISEVVYYLGYRDSVLFSHQFKEEVGLSPKKWRETQLLFKK